MIRVAIRKLRHILSILAALAAGIGISMTLVLSAPEKRQPRLTPLPVHVLPFEVRERDFAAASRVQGQLKPARQTWLHFDISGRVAERRVEPGQTVAAGTRLLLLHKEQWFDAMQRAEAMLNAERKAQERDRRLLELTRERGMLLQREAERLQRLEYDSLASKANLEEAQRRALQQAEELARLEHQARTAEERLVNLQTELRQARRDLESSRLSAPFAGIVNRVELDVGDRAAPGIQAVELVDTRNLDLHLEVTGAVAQGLRLGQEIQIRRPGNPGAREKRLGRIVALAPAPAADTHTHALRVRAERSGDWYPGQIAEAALPVPPLRGVPVVPGTALLRDEGRSYVFRIGEDLRLQRMEVEALKSYDGEVAVRGLAPGTRIVSDNVAALADGQEVRIAP